MRLDGKTQSEPHPMDSSECICESRLISNPQLENSFSATFSSHSLSDIVPPLDLDDTTSIKETSSITNDLNINNNISVIPFEVKKIISNDVISQDKDKPISLKSTRMSTSDLLSMETSSSLKETSPLDNETSIIDSSSLPTSLHSTLDTHTSSTSNFTDKDIDVGFAFIDVDNDIDNGTSTHLVEDCVQDVSDDVNKTSTWRPLPDMLKPPSPPPIKSLEVSSNTDNTTSSTPANATSSTPTATSTEDTGYPRVVTRTLFRKDGLNQVVSRWLEKNGTNYVVKNELFLAKSDVVLTAFLYFDLVVTHKSSYRQED